MDGYRRLPDAADRFQSLLWASKFDDLRKLLETAENSQTSILTCWKSLPKKFDYLKKKPGLHESQLQLGWSGTLLYSLVVERRC